MKYKIWNLVGILMFITVILSGCAKQQTKETGIYDYKTQYVGDNSKVSQIVSMLDYPSGAKYDSIEIQSESEPYALTIYLQEKDKISESDLFYNAVISFALIDNLSILEYKSISTNTTIASFTRDEVDKELSNSKQKSAAEIGADKDTFYTYKNTTVQ